MTAEETELQDLLLNAHSRVHINTKESLRLAHLLLEKANEYNNKFYQAEAYNNLGICHYNLRNLKSAKEKLTLALTSFLELDIPSKIVSCYNSLGALERQIGNYSDALNLYFQAIKLSESINEINPTTYNNIATIYYKQKDFSKALKYYKSALKIGEKNSQNNATLIIGALTNVGNILNEQKKYDLAIEKFEKAIDIGRKLNRHVLYIPALRGLGSLYFSLNRIEEAYNLLNKGLSMCEEGNFNIEIITLSLELSKILKTLGKYEERLKILKQSLSIALDHQHDLIQNCLIALLEHYEDVGDYKNALLVSKKESFFKTEKFRLERVKKLNELQAKFEIRETDKLLDQEKLFSKELGHRNKQLQALNQELEQFNYAVSHDLKEPIRSVKAYTKLLLTHAEAKLDEHELDAIEKLEESIKRMERMIDDLLEFALLGNTGKREVQVNLNDVIQIVQADLQLLIKENSVTFKIDQLPVIKAHKSLMVQLFQNLISNSIKFRKLDVAPEIQILYSELKESHKFRLIDNGIGIPENQKDNVFKLFKRLEKSKNIEGTGIGLSLCQKIITKMQGQIDLASNITDGTEFIISIPKNLERKLYQ